MTVKEFDENQIKGIEFLTMNTDLTTVPVDFKYRDVPICNENHIRVCGYGDDIPYMHVDINIAKSDKMHNISVAVMGPRNIKMTYIKMTYYVERIIMSDILRDAVQFALQCLDDKVVVIYVSVPQMERLF